MPEVVLMNPDDETPRSGKVYVLNAPLEAMVLSHDGDWTSPESPDFYTGRELDLRLRINALVEAGNASVLQALEESCAEMERRIRAALRRPD